VIKIQGWQRSELDYMWMQLEVTPSRKRRDCCSIADMIFSAATKIIDYTAISAMQ
jgi:hypothetical protein